MKRLAGFVTQLESHPAKPDNFPVPIFRRKKEVTVFARIVTMRLKPNTASEFSQTIEKKILPMLRKLKGFRDEITLITEGKEAVGISFWDSKEQAEAYNNTNYPEVLRELNRMVEGTPRIQTCDVANSTIHNIASRAA